ncbi:MULTISPECIES: ABC transporter ATP-binding protein [Spongiibacter]|uniref:ABC transporter ATP-binding protein n=1 Tax=Spongiibacter TaxID=630749 RepID=UPI0003B4434A|nr:MULTISPECIES: ABC transporter ATP-binding protein [Spongiibacter]MBU73824.1 ABC transporter ATP-binding protein [Spongiibacter sp.]|tara:strand:+ start:3404 stop:4408 length:1005 start_codon:yes stop_codon:yes gene_type:complete
MSALIDIRHLTTVYETRAGVVKAVDDISFAVARGETLALVGESGSGKSNAVLSILGLIQSPGKISQGEILFDGDDLLSLSEEDFRRLRGNRISMVFQDPMTALNPLLSLGRQLRDIVMQHLGMNRAQAQQRAIELMTKVGIPDPESRLSDYPHQLSGGMRQRVMIAMALACEPDLLIADEPTTALDVTIQAQIVALIKEIQQEFNMGVIWITHDLGLVATMADRVMVMYAGRIIETADVQALYASPRHPYTRALLDSMPRVDQAPDGPLRAIPGMTPDRTLDTGACRFADRCAFADEHCRTEEPTLVADDSRQHAVSCWKWETLPASAAQEASQ